MKGILLMGMAVFMIMLGSCDGDEDCFENPNLAAPQYVTNVRIKQYSPEPIYIGQIFYPNGSEIIAHNAVNRFFSIKRQDDGGNPITFWWNEQTPPPFSPFLPTPFHPIAEGEEVSFYIAIFNNKTGDFDCLFEEAEKVTSVLDVKVRVENGEVVGEQRITQSTFNVPAGQYAIFEYPFVYNGEGNYQFDVKFSSEGLVEMDTTDNNYTVDLENLGVD